MNIALFEPVFKPEGLLVAERWTCTCTSTRARIELKPGLAANGLALSFERASFEQHGVLPTPGA